MNVVTGIHLFLFNFCFYLCRPSSEKRNGFNIAYSDPAGYHMVSLPSLNICTKHVFYFILFWLHCMCAYISTGQNDKPYITFAGFCQESG